MKYVIYLQRKIEKTTIDSLLVLISEDEDEYSCAKCLLTNMLTYNKTFINRKEFINENITRLYIEYSFQKEQ